MYHVYRRQRRQISLHSEVDRSRSTLQTVNASEVKLRRQWMQHKPATDQIWCNPAETFSLCVVLDEEFILLHHIVAEYLFSDLLFSICLQQRLCDVHNSYFWCSGSSRAVMPPVNIFNTFRSHLHEARCRWSWSADDESSPSFPLAQASWYISESLPTFLICSAIHWQVWCCAHWRPFGKTTARFRPL